VKPGRREDGLLRHTGDVIDGEAVVGFNRARLEQLLGA